MIVTRFAPSPTGHLHIGHAASALFAFEAAQREGGRFLLRIEDIDPVRCQKSFVDGIYEDLHWLGLDWPTPVRCQSEHMGAYEAALNRLRERELLYPCYCTRREIVEEAAAAPSAPHDGPDGEGGVAYAGTCRNLSPAQREELAAQRPAVWRLDVAKALAQTGALRWHDRARGWIEAAPARFGDVVLARKDVATSYHLSVTVDDALQEVSLVTRGEDLLGVTDIHVLLQKLLGFEVPDYHHHPLLLDENGKRFAKRDKAMTLQSLREAGVSAAQIRKMTVF